METLPRPEPNRHRRGVELAVALVLSFVAIFALHGQMQPAVLRAETGYYQVIAHTQPRHERTLLRKFGQRATVDITHHWHLQRSFGSPNTLDSARIGGETGSFF
jgi:hypothetical protein